MKLGLKQNFRNRKILLIAFKIIHLEKVTKIIPLLFNVIRYQPGKQI